LMFFVFLLVAIDFPQKAAVADSGQEPASLVPNVHFRPVTWRGGAE
jgi:hypothetical protein